MSEQLYLLENVYKAYDSRRVLNIGRLDIQQGEILVIVGPNGAGKTTLLRLLNFLERPDGGVIRFRGWPVTEVPLALRRQVTTVFQRPILFSGSVMDNVLYGLRLRGLRSHRAEAQQMLARLGLEKLARMPARKLSGGEAQRVALARALVLRPDVLLLDEPTANLDPYNVQLIEETIRQQNREEGTTVVLVTHNIFQARRLAHRAALLLDGQIVEIAPVQQFFSSPRDSRTRAFVQGEMVY